MTLRQKRLAALAALNDADDNWNNALIARFGRRACEARYGAEGKGEPGTVLRRTYDKRAEAMAAWLKVA